MLKIAIPTNRPQAVVNYVNAMFGSGAQAETGRTFDPDEYDGLLLPGGWDVNPVRYGKTRIPDETIDDDLDAVQFETLAGFLEAGKPVLGICRGHQLLNIAFGGTLIQHLPGAERHQSLANGADNAHMIHIAGNTFLHQIYGSACSVNSTHHQGVDIPGKGMIIAARAEDGVIEATEHESHPSGAFSFIRNGCAFSTDGMIQWTGAASSGFSWNSAGNRVHEGDENER